MPPRPHPFEFQLRKIVGSSLPRGISNILIESGYDTQSTLETIDKNSVKAIEDYVNENRILLKNTVYESLIDSDTIFKFKPGHRAVILSLPTAIQNRDSNEKVANFNVEDLKQSLVKKLSNFATNQFFELHFDVLLIHEFHQVKGSYKCRFECPLCTRKIKCEYKTYWLVSNLENHLKKHYVIVDVATENHSETIAVASEPPKIISYVNSPSQLETLNSILDN